MLIGFILGLLAVPVVGAVVVFSGRFPFEAKATPPSWEARLAGMALDPAVARKAKGLTDPVAATDDELLNGLKVYRGGCAGCHGEPGRPSPWGRNNYPPAPHLAEHGLDDPVPNVFVVAKYGIRYTGMGAWDGLLPDNDLWRVARFLTRIESLPPVVESAWRAVPPPIR
jgi:mono/diheme cytochrome c family protein